MASTSRIVDGCVIWNVSSRATGGWLANTTLIDALALAVPPLPSEIVYVKLSGPL